MADTGNLKLENTGERYIPRTGGAEIAYEHIHRYAIAAELCAGKNVLDIGSGEGYGCSILAERAETVVGIDADQRAVIHAQSRYARPNLSFVRGSASDVPIKGRGLFDVITCFELIEHIVEQERLVREASRLLKEGGLLIISTPNKYLYADERNYSNPFHVKELYLEDFKKLLLSSFRHVSLLGQRVFPGSVITPIVGAGDQRSGPASYTIEKREEGFAVCDRLKRLPMYFIAVASNDPQALSSAEKESFMVDSSEWFFKEKDRLIREREKAIEVKLKEAETREAKIAALLKAVEEGGVTKQKQAAAHAELASRAAAVSKEAAAERERSAALAKEMSALSRLAAEAWAENAKLRSDIINEKRKTISKENALRRMSRDLFEQEIAFREARAALVKALDAAKRVAEAEKKTATGANDALRRVLASRSWRWTRFVRSAFARLFRPAKRKVFTASSGLVSKVNIPDRHAFKEGERVTVSGWCFHKNKDVVSLRLLVGESAYECEFGLERQDVAAAYPKYPFAGRSGFSCSFISETGVSVTVEALLSDGTRESMLVYEAARASVLADIRKALAGFKAALGAVARSFKIFAREARFAGLRTVVSERAKVAAASIRERRAYSAIRKPRVAVLVHLYFEDLWPEIRKAISRIPSGYDLYINLVERSFSPLFPKRLRRECPKAVITVSPNRGYDIGGFVHQLERIDLGRYDLICKVHSKKGLIAQRKSEQKWRERLLGGLLGSKRRVRAIMTLFANNPSVGIVGCREFRTSYMGRNAALFERLCGMIGIEAGERKPDFYAGTMFWARAQVLQAIKDAGIRQEIFEPYDGRRDETMAHAFERVFGALARKAGYAMFDVSYDHRADIFSDSGGSLSVIELAELSRFCENDKDVPDPRSCVYADAGYESIKGFIQKAGSVPSGKRYSLALRNLSSLKESSRARDRVASSMAKAAALPGYDRIASRPLFLFDLRSDGDAAVAHSLRRRFEMIAGMKMYACVTGWSAGASSYGFDAVLSEDGEGSRTARKRIVVSESDSCDKAEKKAAAAALSVLRENVGEDRIVFAKTSALSCCRRAAQAVSVGDHPEFRGMSDIRAAFVVSSVRDSAVFGDVFTAKGLMDAIVRAGGRAYLIDANDPALLPGTNMVVSMLNTFDIWMIPWRRGLIKAAWVRNWAEDWMKRAWFPNFDIVFASSDVIVRLIEEAGFGMPVRKLMIGADTRLFRPVDVPRAYDAVFVGSIWGKDRDISERVASLGGFKLGVFGKGWEKVPSVKGICGGPVPYRNVPRIYSSAWIVLDDQHEETRPYDSINSRVFEAMSCGRMVITNANDSIREILGEAVVPVRDPEKLREAVGKILADKEEYEHISKKARETIERSHSYDVRARQFLSIVQSAFNRYQCKTNEVRN